MEDEESPVETEMEKEGEVWRVEKEPGMEAAAEHIRTYRKSIKHQRGTCSHTSHNEMG